MLFSVSTYACSNRPVNAGSTGMVVEVTGLSQNQVDIEVKLGESSDPFESLLGFVFDFKIPNGKLTAYSTAEVFVNESWVCADNAYAMTVLLDLVENRLSIQMSRNDCASISGFGTALKLRLKNVEVHSRQSFYIANPGGLVIEEIVNLTSGPGLGMSEYTEPLDSAFAAIGPHASEGTDGEVVIIEPRVNTGSTQDGDVLDPLASGSESAFLCYPNPSSGILNLAFENEVSGTLHILDALGREVFQLEIANEKAQKLDLSALPAGCYWVQLPSATGKKMTQKILLQ